MPLAQLTYQRLGCIQLILFVHLCVNLNDNKSVIVNSTEHYVFNHDAYIQNVIANFPFISLI